MVTPDFEDWLERQDIPIELTIDIDANIDAIAKELGIVKGSIDVAKDVYKAKYEILPDVGIRPVERVYTIAGEKFVETRYAITGEPGLWGKISAYRIAEERLTERYDFARADIARTIREDAESQPIFRRRRYED